MREVALGEASEIIMGQSPEGSLYNATGLGLPLINGSAQFGDRSPVTSTFSSSGHKISRPGDIILSVRASVGDLNWSDRRYYLGRGVAAIRVDSNAVSPLYMWHFLLTQREELNRRATGSTFKQVKRGDIAAIKVPLPSLPEQERIASILDRAEALREKRRASRVLCDAFLDSTLREAVGDVRSQSLRPLTEFLNFITSGGRGWAKYYSSSGARFIRSIDVRMNAIDDRDAVFVVPPNNAEAIRTRVRPNDVLLTITGSRIGRVARAPSDLDGAYVSQHVAILRLKPDLDPVFLSHYLAMPSGGQVQIERAQYGQTKPGLNFEQIREFKVPVLDPEMQDQVVEIITRRDQLVSAQSLSTRLLDDLFVSLQARAFRGEL
jgi:type I restriction enzyme, S subunit